MTDSNRQFILAIVRAASIQDLGAVIANGLARRRSVVLARLWMSHPQGTLTLIASAGTPSGGGSYLRTDGEFREMAVSDAAIAEIAATRVPLIVRGVRGDEDWLTNAGWAARQGVRSIVGLPLVDADATLGVLAVIERSMVSDEFLADLSFVADVAAARATTLPAHESEGVVHRQSPAGTKIVTRADVRQIEKENIQAALTRAGGRIFGANGAAALLDMRPTTLASRIKALGIPRSGAP